MGSAGSRFFTLAALAAVLYAIPADAQNGRISGVVRDDRGVGMSGAMVRALNQRTGASSRTTSAADGSYTVSALSPGVYTVVASFDLDPLRLSVLADALEDAGCTQEAILSHLRSPGPHVRGCWALDVILGNQ